MVDLREPDAIFYDSIEGYFLVDHDIVGLNNKHEITSDKYGVCCSSINPLPTIEDTVIYSNVPFFRDTTPTFLGDFYTTPIHSLPISKRLFCRSFFDNLDSVYYSWKTSEIFLPSSYIEMKEIAPIPVLGGRSHSLR